MKILLAALFLAVSLPAFAETDPKIHKLCIEAKDYVGCVSSMKGETSSETTVNQIQQQAANLTEGNSCPAKKIYSGSGYCQRVICVSGRIFSEGNNKGLAGKAMSCNGGKQLIWNDDHEPIRASLNKSCPPGNLEVGFMNTCQQARARGYATYYTSGYKRSQNGKVDKVFGNPAKGKLQVGDKIISINGLDSKEYVHNMIKPTSIQLIIERQGEQLEFTWTTKLQREEFTKTKDL